MITGFGNLNLKIITVILTFKQSTPVATPPKTSNAIMTDQSQRYRATPSHLHDGSYNVIDMQARADNPERCFVAVALTRSQAVQRAAELNQKSQ